MRGTGRRGGCVIAVIDTSAASATWRWRAVWRRLSAAQLHRHRRRARSGPRLPAPRGVRAWREAHGPDAHGRVALALRDAVDGHVAGEPVGRTPGGWVGWGWAGR